jgi:hypothetical protein
MRVLYKAKTPRSGCDAHICLNEGFTFLDFCWTRLCTKCARIERFQFIWVSFERKQIPRFIGNVSS